ncbi:hypothetical protein PG984_016087 [Apiospora sp. TS-2023a]
MERGTGESSSGAESAQPKAATLSKTSRESDTQNRSHVLSSGSNKSSSGSSLEEVQRQLALSLVDLVQNTVEKETKELLRQIRDNSERQITLLKASLADSWRNPGQTSQLRTALSSEEPWRPSDEGLVNIEVGGNDQELHSTDSNYTLQALQEDFESIEKRDRTAMLIILAVWGFARHILDDPELRADSSVPHSTTSRNSSDAYPDPLNLFFESVASNIDQFSIRLIHHKFPRHLELKLKQGGNFIRMTSTRRMLRRPNKEFARLIMQEWLRTSRIRSIFYWDPDRKPRMYYWGLNRSGVQGDREYGSFDIIHAPLIRTTDTFMELADMARVISRSALTMPGGFNSTFCWMAINFLLSFTGPWKSLFGPFGPHGYLGSSEPPRHSCYLHKSVWRLPEKLSESDNKSELNLERKEYLFGYLQAYSSHTLYFKDYG